VLRLAEAYYPSWDRPYAEHLGRAFEMRVDRKVGTLSKGETRRLQLLLALAHRPPLLLLDEPTDGLDPLVRRRALALLAEHLTDTPTTVVLSTHQVHEVQDLADHLGVLRGGRLVVQMSRDELHRTVRRYEAEIPDGWEAPSELAAVGLRRWRGKEMQWTVVGDEDDVTRRLTRSGVRVRQVRPLALEDAALALLAEEITR
jgi:ABC-2 type transport system ATP-binding protein